MKQEYITTIRSYAKHKLHKHIQPNETLQIDQKLDHVMVCLNHINNI